MNNLENILFGVIFGEWLELRETLVQNSHQNGAMHWRCSKEILISIVCSLESDRNSMVVVFL